MAWHETHSALFGAKITPETAQAWTGVWAFAGYTDAVLNDAVLGIARLPIHERPKWPEEHLEMIERLASRILIDRAAAGQLGGKELMFAASLAKADYLRKRDLAKTKCLGVYEWDPERGLPEAKDCLRAKEVLERIQDMSGAVRIEAKPSGKLPGHVDRVDLIDKTDAKQALLRAVAGVGDLFNLPAMGRGGKA